MQLQGTALHPPHHSAATPQPHTPPPPSPPHPSTPPRRCASRRQAGRQADTCVSVCQSCTGATVCNTMSPVPVPVTCTTSCSTWHRRPPRRVALGVQPRTLYCHYHHHRTLHRTTLPKSRQHASTSTTTHRHAPHYHVAPQGRGTRCRRNAPIPPAPSTPTAYHRTPHTLTPILPRRPVPKYPAPPHKHAHKQGAQGSTLGNVRDAVSKRDVCPGCAAPYKHSCASCTSLSRVAAWPASYASCVACGARLAATHGNTSASLHHRGRHAAAVTGHHSATNTPACRAASAVRRSVVLHQP